ncbi:7-cyano-7-deazaguanine synthase QueC [bacterium]|nr:7-cyano-7-deazaguanine synthase QueC [bacterium]
MSYTKALVVFSGGQDSTTCLAVACSEFEWVETVTFDYGQRHRIELAQAAKLADIAGVKQHHQLDMRWLGHMTENALTRTDIPITHEEGELPSTFVPGRNLFFLSVAAVLARQRGIQTIYTGVCETDYSGYPDCRNEFITSLNRTLNLGIDYPFDIRTPLMWLTKKETVELMQSLGRLDWYADTHTCYEGTRPACGKCPACLLRLAGFEAAGYQDPLNYRI